MATPTTEIANTQANVIIAEKDKDLLDYAYGLKRMRENWEPMAYLSRRAYEGRHLMYWNKDLKKLTDIPQRKNMPTTLPEVKKQADAFENFLSATDYVFTVIPDLLSEDDAVKESMMLSMLAKKYHKKLKDSTVLADMIHYAIVDSNVSFIEVSPDQFNKDVTYYHWDFFDVLFNPLIHKWEDQKIICKIIKKDVPSVKESELYHLPSGYVAPGVGGEWLSYKDVYEAERYASFSNLDTNMMLLFEFHILETYTDEKTGDKSQRLRIKTLDGAGNVIRNDVYNAVKRMSIQPLRIYSGEWWQPGYVYGLIPINRSLDNWADRFDDMMVRLTKGGWLVQEEEDVQGQMNEEMGQVVKYNSVKPEPIVMGSVPNFFVEFFSIMQSLSDRYGLNSIFSGNLPNKASGLRAGKMIDQIKGLTQQNNTTVLDHLKSTLKGVLEITFGFLYEMWDEPQDRLESDDPLNGPKFISEKYADLHQEDNVFKIPAKFKKFTVEVDDGMGYTLDKKKETAVQLNKMLDEQGKPILSSKALKSIFKLGASGYLMEADEKPMHETKEFQALINSFPSMSDQEKQALITTLQTMGKQNANNPAAASNPNSPLMAAAGAGGASKGGSPKPPQPPAPQPPPQDPKGGGQ